jgi:hypothetical protein
MLSFLPSPQPHPVAKQVLLSELRICTTFLHYNSPGCLHIFLKPIWLYGYAFTCLVSKIWVKQYFPMYYNKGRFFLDHPKKDPICKVPRVQSYKPFPSMTLQSSLMATQVKNVVLQA